MSVVSNSRVTIICKIFVWYGNYDIGAYTVAVAKGDRTDGIPETFLGDKRQTDVFEKSFKEGIKQGVCGLYGMFQVCMLLESFGFDLRNDIDDRVNTLIYLLAKKMLH